VPTYQYTCTDCGEPVEAVQKFTDDPLTVCAACGGRLRKVFSPVGIVFKGPGFYRTDSRNGSISPSDAKKDKQPAESKSSSTSDSNGSEKGSEKGRDKKDSKSKDSVGTSAKSSSEKVA
jgi:putative FmdB family regulatory protein